MSKMDLIRQRHSVRQYTDRPVEGGVLGALQSEVAACAEASGLDIQLVTDNPEVFDVVASFGLIHGCRTSIAFMVPDKSYDEAIGFWGQRIVLRAQELGLNTCWVAMCARKKSAAVRTDGRKVRLVIAVGYGENAGYERKTKAAGEISSTECANVPAWFATAVEAAQLAPTAVNAQNFSITLRADGKTVSIQAPTRGFAQIDLGIVKRNFQEAANELGADWKWE